MIVDCHTHVWQSPDQLGQLVLGDMFRHSKNRQPRAMLAAPVMRSIPSADADHHWSQSGTVDKAIVLGFKSRYLNAEIPNRYVSDYVNRFPQKLIGFAGIDPTERGSAAEVRTCKNELRLRGVTVSAGNVQLAPASITFLAVPEARNSDCG